MKEPKEHGKELRELSGEDLLKFVKEVSGYTEREISRISMMYKLAAGCLTVIVAVGIYFTFKDSSEFRKYTREEIAAQKASIKDEIAREEAKMRERQESLFTQLQIQLSSQVKNLGNEVEQRVDEEFKSDKINKLVHDKAQSRIDTIADPIIASKVSTKLQPTIDQVNNNVKQIQDDIVSTRSNINKLQVDSEFLNVIATAQSDDKQSFDKLKRWGEDPTFYRSNDAYQAYLNIIDNFDSVPEENNRIRWEDNFNPSKTSFDALKKMYLEINFAEQRAGLLQYIWNRKDFSKKQKMGLMIVAMKNDKSLKVVCKASRLFQNEAMKNIKCLYTHLPIDWWDKNKETVSDKVENSSP